MVYPIRHPREVSDSTFISRISLPAATIAFLRPTLQLVSPTPWQRAPRLPVKKALLIAICSTTHEENFPTLNGPKEDIERFRTLLLNQYGYDPENITVMSDQDPECPERLQPTKVNIMRELKSFTADVRPGDEFVFQYAGHSHQRDNLDNTEEDGMDELMVTMDGEEIVDDDLNYYLVKALIPGCSLVAVLDTCHSQSLLDLDHHRCNRVSNIFSSTRRRVRRKASETKATISPRINGMIPPSPLLHTEEPSSSTLGSLSRGQPSHTAQPPQRTNTLSSLRQGVAISKRGVEMSVTGINRFCRGTCHRFTNRNQPYVLCISACKDGQNTMDDDGLSMTSALIDVLSKEPRPTLKFLMRGVAQTMLEHNTRAYEIYHKRYLQWLEAERKKGGFKKLKKPRAIMCRISDPQLSSLSPLFMNDHLTL
ncbi:caspase domain-containing protein [Flagelloscypha sp. PMI_526]|nr:caspase domain-containing protein [Flagelloscypha sp. PMI_526]